MSSRTAKEIIESVDYDVILQSTAEKGHGQLDKIFAESMVVIIAETRKRLLAEGIEMSRNHIPMIVDRVHNSLLVGERGKVEVIVLRKTEEFALGLEIVFWDQKLATPPHFSTKSEANSIFFSAIERGRPKKRTEALLDVYIKSIETKIAQEKDMPPEMAEFVRKSLSSQIDKMLKNFEIWADSELYLNDLMAVVSQLLLREGSTVSGVKAQIVGRFGPVLRRHAVYICSKLWKNHPPSDIDPSTAEGCFDMVYRHLLKGSAKS